jgi:hypothetical protein
MISFRRWHVLWMLQLTSTLLPLLLPGWHIECFVMAFNIISA